MDKKSPQREYINQILWWIVPLSELAFQNPVYAWENKYAKK